VNNRFLDRIHKRWLIRSLKRFNGNKKEVAMYLGVSVRTIRNWIIDFGLKGKI